MQEKVSIIIPVYNREKLIERAIESAINQTYENLEIIITDNCSTDNTYKVCMNYAQKDKRIKVYKNDENLGPVKNWIEGISKATGEYIKIIWSDDWIDEDFIEESMKCMKNDVAFVFSKAYLHCEDINLKERVLYKIFEENTTFSKEIFIENSILHTSSMLLPVSAACMLLRTKDIKNKIIIDIPNEENLDFNIFGAGNDLLMFLLPLLENEYSKVAYIDTVSAHFLGHKGSFTTTNDLEKYYDYARVYFSNLYGNNLIKDKLKATLLIKKSKESNYDKVYKLCEGVPQDELLLEYFQDFIKIENMYKNREQFMMKWISSIVNNELISNKIDKKYGNKNISIYGCGTIGMNFYKQLKNENKIKVNYFIDKIATDKIDDISCLNISDYIKQYNSDDLIIVTPFYYFDEIATELKKEKPDINLVSVEEFV